MSQNRAQHMDSLPVAVSNSLMSPPVFWVQKSLKKIMSLSIFMSYQKYLKAHKCFILLLQLTHKVAMLTTLEHKHSASLMEDHLLVDFSMEDENSYCLTLCNYRKLICIGSVLSRVSTDILSSWPCTKQGVKSVQSCITVDYVLPSWILEIKETYSAQGEANTCSSLHRAFP